MNNIAFLNTNLKDVLTGILFICIFLLSTLINTSICKAQPANDDCANAIALTPGDPCIPGTTVDATLEPLEDLACNIGMNQSVWYSFVADNDSMDVIAAYLTSGGCYFGSVVWDGIFGCPTTSMVVPAILSCEDDIGGPLNNIHNLTGLTIGNTYYIQVLYDEGGICGNNSSVEFCISVAGSTWLGNDACANAYEAMSNVVYSTNNFYATPDLSLCLGSTENNIWFTWTVPPDWDLGDNAFVHLFNQLCDWPDGMQLSVFEVDSCSQLPDPAVTSDCIFYSSTQTSNDIYFQWTPTQIGATYYFNLDGWASSLCDFDFLISNTSCLTILSTSISGSSCSINNGSATIIASNSTGPYTFNWDPAGTVTSTDTSSTNSGVH